MSVFNKCFNALGNCCGNACSICCLVWSSWGVLTLVIVGILLDFQYPKIDNGVIGQKCSANITTSDCYDHAATQCYIGSGIYLAFCIICAIRLFYLQKFKPSPAVPTEQ